MAHAVCPWWLGWVLASPIRKLFEDPHRLLSPYVKAGDTVIEPGPGMGFFTLELARLVGAGGRVIAVDLQPQMLAGLERRARRAGLADRIETRLARPDELGVSDLAGAADFVLAIAVVHELPDPARFFAEIVRTLKPDGKVLFGEPAGHVGAVAFGASLALASSAGLHVVERPGLGRSHAALLARG